MTEFRNSERKIEEYVGKRIRERRLSRGLTQNELGKMCGVRFQQIQKYECGENRIHTARLWKIADALKVSVNHFFIGLKTPSEIAEEGKASDSDSAPASSS